MNQIQLTDEQWQVVIQALLNVHAPMAQTGPVYSALMQQLKVPAEAQQPAAV